MKDLIIAIDGYSSCGKSTFAKAIAAKLGYIFIDTGAMYRAVALAALRAGLFEEGELDIDGLHTLLAELDLRFVFNEQRGASDIYLGDECVEGTKIRTMEVNSVVSNVSAVEQVRTKLVSLQQQMGRSGGVVMDGRDIGSVVFPEAEIKIFMEADPYVRAKRRYDELTAAGAEVSLEQIVANVEERDRADERRAVSPLRRTADAVVLDNSAMSVEQQMAWFDELYASKREAR
ncbi:MAG: (d)CMP kinase [Rikenellaceae bacterium]